MRETLRPADAVPSPAMPERNGRPHVAHIVGTLGAGGVQKLILTLAATPSGRAYRYSVVCLFGAEGRFAERFAEAGIPVTFCPVPWPHALPVGSHRASKWIRDRLGFTFPFRLARELRRRGVDLVHSHLAHRIDLQAAAVLRRCELPLIWTIHSLYDPNVRELRRWRRATRLAETHPSAIAAVAEEIARDFRARGLDHPGGIEVIRGGVDLSAFPSEVPRDAAWRSRWGIPPDSLVVGAAGRLVVQKGYDVLIRAARRVLQEGIDAHFVIAGDGPLRESLQAEAARAGLGSRFQLVGFQSDVPRFLAQLDVFVLSSRLEGFPIALLEALAARLPVIATPVGGVPEMLGATGGLIVPVESDEALAAAVRSMADPEARAAFASSGRAMAERFPLEKTADQFAALYARLIGEKAQSSQDIRRTRIPWRKVKVKVS